MDARSEHTHEPQPPATLGDPVVVCLDCRRGRVGLHAPNWAANHRAHLAGEHRIASARIDVDAVMRELAHLGYPEPARSGGDAA